MPDETPIVEDEIDELDTEEKLVVEEKPVAKDYAEDIAGLTTGLSELSNIVKTFVSAQSAPRPAPVDTSPGRLTSDELFADPDGAIDKKMTQMFQKNIAPVGAQFAGQLASFAIKQFKQEKASDPLYSGVAPLFSAKVSGLNLTWLGALNEDQQAQTLNEAWNASVGEYVNQKRKANAGKQKPVNLGGGSSSGSGGGGQKTLQELDPVAYRAAVQAGLSEEDMKEIAKEVLAGGGGDDE